MVKRGFPDVQLAHDGQCIPIQVDVVKPPPELSVNPPRPDLPPGDPAVDSPEHSAGTVAGEAPPVACGDDATGAARHTG